MLVSPEKHILMYLRGSLLHGRKNVFAEWHPHSSKITVRYQEGVSYHTIVSDVDLIQRYIAKMRYSEDCEYSSAMASTSIDFNGIEIILNKREE
jgi:hypothetical protein